MFVLLRLADFERSSTRTKPPHLAATLLDFRPFCDLLVVPKLVRLLEVGFILNVRDLPAFRVAFEPAAVKWDVDPGPYIQQTTEAVQGARQNHSESICSFTLPCQTNERVSHITWSLGRLALKPTVGGVLHTTHGP